MRDAATTINDRTREGKTMTYQEKALARRKRWISLDEAKRRFISRFPQYSATELSATFDGSLKMYGPDNMILGEMTSEERAAA